MVTYAHAQWDFDLGGILDYQYLKFQLNGEIMYKLLNLPESLSPASV